MIPASIFFSNFKFVLTVPVPYPLDPSSSSVVRPFLKVGTDVISVINSIIQKLFESIITKTIIPFLLPSV